MREELHEGGIGTGVHFLSLAEHPYYHERFGDRFELPNAAYVSARTLSLPLSAKLTDEEVHRIITAVREVCAKGGRT
jgi:dTDP-4-amino-4,6-dideoxygalactose transaminase